MLTIFKYPLERAPEQFIEMPAPAILLSVAEQYGLLALWAIVDPSKPALTRRIVIKETGRHVDRDLPSCFLGTVLLNEGRYVVHVFCDMAWERERSSALLGLMGGYGDGI